MVSSQGKLLRWSVLHLLHGETVDVVHSKGKTPEAAFKNLPSHIREMLKVAEYKVEPFPERLRVRARHNLTFEVPGLNGENGYKVDVHEYYNGVGFSYQPILETATDLERIAPMSVVQKLAVIANNIVKDLELQPKVLVIVIKESPGIGNVGYEGRSIVGRSRLVCIELELFSFPLQDVDYWEGILWHEAMHAKYILDRRWPSIWPFYAPDAGPLWALDSLLHFCIDGWLERNNKPTVFWAPTDKPDADFKSSRLYELREGLQSSSCMVAESLLTKVADDLWGRETNIWEVWKIMQELGLTIPKATPLGQYVRRCKARPTSSS